MGYDDLRKEYDPTGALKSVPDDEFLAYVADHDTGKIGRAAGPQGAPIVGSGKVARATPAAYGDSFGIGQATNAATTIAELGGLGKAIGGIPKRGLKEGAEMIRGIGPLMGGILHAATLGPRLAVHDPTAGLEAEQAARAIGRAAPQMAKQVVQNVGEEVANPVGSFTKRPLSTSLDALALADLPALALRGGANVAARTGAKSAAMKMAEGAELATPGAVLGRTSKAAEEGIPAYGAWKQAGRDRMATRKALAMEDKVGAQQKERMGAQIEQAFEGLRPSERETLTPVAMGTASLAPNPTRPPTIIERLLHKGPQASDKEAMERALEWFRGRQKSNEANAVARGELTPEIAETRRFQPLRIATGGEDQLKYEAAPRKPYNVKGLEKRAKFAEKTGKAARKKGVLAAIKESEIARLGPSLKQSNVETAALIAAEKRAARYAGRSEQAQKGLKPLEDIDERVAGLKDQLASERAQFAERQEAGRRAVGQARQLGRAEGVSTQAQKHLAELDEIDAALSEWRNRAANEALPQRLPWQHSEPSNRLDPRRVAAENIGRLEEKRRIVLSNLTAVAKAESKVEKLRGAAAPKGGITKIVGLVNKIAREEERRGAMVRGGEAVTKAELGLEGAKDAALASKAAIPGRPVTLARKIGKTEAQLSEANRWQRVAQTNEQRAAKLTATADARRGRVPAMERLQRQTEQVKWQMPNADPIYVPQLAKKGEAVREMIRKTFKKQTVSAGTPGFYKQSSGTRFAEGTMEPDLAKIAARHEQARIDYRTRVRQLQKITAMPFARPVKSMHEVDWSKEMLIDPEAFTLQGEGIDAVSKALSSTNPQGELANAARQAVQKAPGKAAGSQLYAVPKAVGKELEGQLKSAGPASPLMQAIFDKPNDYLRLTALTLRPGFYVNNLVGNAALATLSGATPSSLVRAIKDRDAIPSAVRGTGFAAVEAPGASVTMGKLGKVGKIPHAMNEAVDDLFRHASFKSAVDKEAMKQSILQTGERLKKNMTDAEKMALIGPEGEARALEHVNQFLNDYSIQAPWQKRVLRRVMPFQSFLVHMGKLATRLPATHPMRANLLSKLSELGNEYQDEQFREVGVEPENVAPWRKNQLPIRNTDTGAVTFGTGGLNPASGLGGMNADLVVDQGVPQLLRTAADNMGPIPQWAMAGITGEKPIGIPFSKPGIKNKFGTDTFTNEAGEEVGAPVPGPIDLVRQNTPLLQLIEALAQPNETYDLVGSPIPGTKNYLPSRYEPPRPRRYGFLERLLGYGGVPVRDFEREELVKR